MFKIIKKITLSSLSILGISFICWLVVLLNPSFLYASQTQIDQVTIYHNQPLEDATESVVKNAISILKRADIYEEDLNIELCLNDGSIYPELWIYKGATGYAFLNKTVIYHSQPDFEKKYTSFSWEVNDYEERRANLTWLLAHEMTHNLQSNQDRLSPVRCEFWKNEGHAEYISRQFKQDGKLKEKITFLIEEEKKPHKGIPVFKLDDGTIFNLSYFKYALLTQYLIEEKEMNYSTICEDERSMDAIEKEMMTWYQS